jgi:spore germination cell wall hydrolase CwlJ-like protein
MKIHFQKFSLVLCAALAFSTSLHAKASSHNTGFSKPFQVAFFGKSQKNSRLIALKKDAARLIRKAPSTLYKETALGCIAVAVYHEARGETVLGQKAVASVVIQRSITPGRWGDTPCDVVKPVQFEFMKSRYRFERIREKEAWKLAVRVALTMMYEGPMEELRNADHYHTKKVYPKWRKSMPVVARIGEHIFYADPDSSRVRQVSR